VASKPNIPVSRNLCSRPCRFLSVESSGPEVLSQTACHLLPPVGSLDDVVTLGKDHRVVRLARPVQRVHQPERVPERHGRSQRLARVGRGGDHRRRLDACRSLRVVERRRVCKRNVPRIVPQCRRAVPGSPQPLGRVCSADALAYKDPYYGVLVRLGVGALSHEDAKRTGALRVDRQTVPRHAAKSRGMRLVNGLASHCCAPRAPGGVAKGARVNHLNWHYLTPV
jgi:hypothetical protein